MTIGRQARRHGLLVTSSLTLLLAAACGAGAPDATRTSPTADAVASPDTASVAAAPVDARAEREIQEAIRFRRDFGLRSDDAWVRSVAVDPRASSDRFAVPLLPYELADLEARARAREASVPVIQEYTAQHPDSFGGLYLEQQDGGVPVVLFVGDPIPHAAALKALLHPDALFRVREVKHTLRQLEGVQTRLFEEDEWLATIPARAIGASVMVAENQVEASLQVNDRDALPAITARIGGIGMIRYDVHPFRPDRGTGTIRGRIVDSDGKPLHGLDFNVVAIGDIDAAEPTFGGYGTDPKGGFVIEDLRVMGWTISIVRPRDEKVVGRAHVEVTRGRVTEVDIVVDLD